MTAEDLEAQFTVENQEYATIRVWSQRLGRDPLFLEIALGGPDTKPIIGCYRGVTFRLYSQEDVRRLIPNPTS